MNLDDLVTGLVRVIDPDRLYDAMIDEVEGAEVSVSPLGNDTIEIDIGENKFTLVVTQDA